MYLSGRRSCCCENVKRFSAPNSCPLNAHISVHLDRRHAKLFRINNFSLCFYSFPGDLAFRRKHQQIAIVA